MTQTQTKRKSEFDIIKVRKAANVGLKICAAVAAACALLLTFTVGDYYIFNRIGEYGFFFCLSQWVKKAGLILVFAAAFFNCRSLGDAAKYFLPVFIILSCCLFGEFFDVAPSVSSAGESEEVRQIFNSINLLFPKWLNVTLFFVQNVALMACCGFLVVESGVKVKPKSLIALPFALLLALPLNIFENFFDINSIPADSFLRFKNFTLWHFLALCVLVGSTLGLYYFLKNKTRAQQDKYLAVIAVSLLLQYHSKDSFVMGDGYNVYYTVFACLPLFICNIGVYVASLSVIFKKRFLYAISFFIHAVGALTVFVYFGKDEMSNYGIFCSHSILYFCLTHCMLFALCVLPSALGHYKFKIKDCIIPLIYYCVVIIIAAVASGLVTDFLTGLSYNGHYLTVGEGAGFDMTPPNYAFTQVNPLPFEVPNLIPLGGAMESINLFYVVLVYVAYVCLFFAFFGVYRAFLAVRGVVLTKIAERRENGKILRSTGFNEKALEEAAVTDETDGAYNTDGGAVEEVPADETVSEATVTDETPDGAEAEKTEDAPAEETD